MAVEHTPKGKRGGGQFEETALGVSLPTVSGDKFDKENIPP
jgi:hypothetical protein